MKIKLITVNDERTEFDTNDIVEYKKDINYMWHIVLKDGKDYFVVDSFADITDYIWSLGRESGIRDCTKKAKRIK